MQLAGELAARAGHDHAHPQRDGGAQGDHRDAQARGDHRRAHGSPAASANRAGPGAGVQSRAVEPVAVVTQFYADITAQNYGAAWALGGDNLAGTSYASWVAGYGTTAAIAVTAAENFGSDQATASISATQSDGSVRNYSGTYTVQDGVIVSAQITQQ